MKMLSNPPALLLTLTTLLFAAAPVAAQTFAPPTDPKGCGCRDLDPPLRPLPNPHWAEVIVSPNDPQPYLPHAFPDGVTGIVYWSHIATNDLPFNHNSHDLNFFVRLDDRFMHL